MTTCPTCDGHLRPDDPPHVHVRLGPRSLKLHRDALDPDPLHVDVDPRVPVHSPATRRRSTGCFFVAIALWLAIAVLLIATPRSAAIPTASRPGASGTIGDPDRPAQAMASASGWPLIGAPLPSAGVSTTARGAPSPRAEASAAPSGAEITAISSGIASWYDAAGDQGAVPWWEPGQEPLWAAVSSFEDGTTRSVTVLITGFCQCLVGTPDERAIDLSRNAFVQLADPGVGLVRVQIEIGVQGPTLPPTDVTQ